VKRWRSNFVLFGGVVEILLASYLLLLMFQGADAPRSLAAASLAGTTGSLLVYAGMLLRRKEAR
jgi:hypothetical protein